MKEMNKIILEDDEIFIDTCVTKISNTIRNLIKEADNESRLNIALSGGSTPIPILKKLAKSNLPWEKLNFHLVDERFVKIDDERLNFKNIHEVFFRFVENKSRINSLVIENTDIDSCLDKANEKLKLSNSTFDFVILGMGEDGHTASLFPNSKGLLSNVNGYIKNFVDSQNMYRITMTFPTILESKNILILIKGQNKHQIFKDLYSENITNYPMQRIVDNRNDLNWIICK